MNEAALRGIGHPRTGALRLASDARLVRIAVRGERRAFAAIFQRYHQELYRYCRAILGSEEEASDALQNTMVKVMRALPGESREIALRPWLYRIAHNEAIALLRQRRDSAELSDEIAAGAPLEHRVQERERLRHLVRDLRSLPDRQRGALVMRELNDVNYSAIGAAFGTSSAVARQTVYEARVALQEMAEGREMSCDVVRQALSDGDGRVLRGRRLRAHLRGCEGCRDFLEGIRQRRADLRSLAPAMPAAAAAGLLQSIVGSGHAGGGAGLLGSIGGGGKVLAGSGALKAAAAVAATATIAVGTADITGVIHPPLIGRSSSPSAPTASPAPAAPAVGAGSRGASGASAKPAAGGLKAKVGKGTKASANSPGHSKAGHDHSKGATAPGHTGSNPSGTRGNSAFGKSHAPKSPPKATKSNAPVAGANAQATHPSHPAHPSHSSSKAGSTKSKPAPPALPPPPAPPAGSGSPHGP